MDFNELSIEQRLHPILQGMGISSATLVQQRVIPAALSGECVLAISNTGSGKSLAYLLPLVQRLAAEGMSGGVRAIVLAPTRELAMQIWQVANKLCGAVGLRVAAIYGGVEYAGQRAAISDGVDIVVATPGRLMDLVRMGDLVSDGLSVLVLDEVDQMLDLGFREDVLTVASWCVKRAQVLCLSATKSDALSDLLPMIMPQGYSSLECNDGVLALAEIVQDGYYVTADMMDHLLLYLLRRDAPTRAIIFTRSRSMADRLTKLLAENGIAAEAMHSDRTQAAREHILERFRCGECAILVATDVVARGIDIADVERVYNYGMPLEVQQYIHRIGRTGRGGASGFATLLSVPEDSALVSQVCKLMRCNIKMSITHPYVKADMQRLVQLGANTQKGGTRLGKKGKKMR